MTKTIIDISRPLKNAMPLYPNNPPYEIKVIRKYEKLNSEGREGSQLSIVTSGSHNGTHIDGGVHCGLPNGVEKWPLDCFYGQCRVIALEEIIEITNKHLEKHSLQRGERILLKTDNSTYAEFRNEFTHIGINAAKYIAEKELKLIGVDGFAIQKRGSPTQDVHRTLLSKMPIIEGLCLKHVEPGSYTLCAFPLAMTGDGALTRAVLIK